MIIEAQTQPGDRFMNYRIDVDLDQLGDLPFVIRVRPDGKGWNAELIWDDDGEPNENGHVPLPSVIEFWQRHTNPPGRYRNSAVFYGRTIRKAVRSALRSALSVYEELLIQAAEASVQKAQEISVP